MKSKMPEVIALILVVLALVIPPWKMIGDIWRDTVIYETRWALIFQGPPNTGQIDVVLLVIELLVIAGIYFLLKLILKPPKT
jgi:hypothetical protein